MSLLTSAATNCSPENDSVIGSALIFGVARMAQTCAHEPSHYRMGNHFGGLHGGASSIRRFHVGLFSPDRCQRPKFTAIHHLELARRSFRGERLHGLSESKECR